MELSFGRNLSDFLPLQLSRFPYFDVPLVFEGLARHLFLHHLDTPGIFRVPGSLAEIRALQERVDIFQPFDLPAGDPLHCHVVAGLLKLYLRQLPTPLLPRFADFADCATSRVDVDGARVASALGTLDPARLKMLGMLCSLCAAVEAHSEVNQMTFDNLATCLAPSVLYEASLAGVEMGAAFERAKRANCAFQYILENQKALGLDCDLNEFDMALAGHNAHRVPLAFTNSASDLGQYMAENGKNSGGMSPRAAPSPIKRTVSFLHSAAQNGGTLQKRFKASGTIRMSSASEIAEEIRNHHENGKNSKDLVGENDDAENGGGNGAGKRSVRGRPATPLAAKKDKDRFGSLRAAGGAQKRRHNVLDYFNDAQLQQSNSPSQN